MVRGGLKILIGALVLVLASVLLTGCASAGPKNASAVPAPGGILVSWTAPDSSAVMGYNVYRSMQSGVMGQKANPVILSNTSYMDSNVRDGTTYYYTIRSVNSGGSEDGSGQVNAVAKINPPTNEEISIGNGGEYTNTTAETLYLSAIGASKCRYSNDGATWTDWTPYASTYPWTLPDKDGPKDVYYQCKDDVGNTAQPVSASIYLDMTPPVLSISSPAQGGQYGGGFDIVFTPTDPSPLTLNCSGDLDGTQIAIGIVDSNKEDTTSVIAKSGQHTLTIQCSDGINIARKSVMFSVVDKPAVELSIESGAGYTDIQKVMLDVAATPAATECRFSNDQKAWNDWSAYSASMRYSWTLSGGDGTKTVYAQCRNTGGQVSDTASDTIVLDSSPPPYISVEINNGDKWTDTKSVLLGLYAFSAKLCRFSNDGYSWTGWEQYSNLRQWTLAGDYGTKTVYYECQDKNGGEIGTASASIIYSDREPNPPTNVKVSINGGDSTTHSADVTLSLRASNADDCRLKENSGSWTDWNSYGTSMDWTLSTGNGKKTVYYQCRNDYGTTGASSSIYLDMGPPAKITDLWANPSVDAVYLHWSRPSNDIRYYHIYRSTSGFGLFTLLSTSYSPSYSDQEVVAGMTYSYSVKAVDSNGDEGPDSNIVTATAGLLTGSS